MYIGLHVKYLLLLSDFNGTWIFSKYFRKIFKYQISWKAVQWEHSCSMRTNKQSDKTTLIVVFRKFAKAPEDSACWTHIDPLKLFMTSERTHILDRQRWTLHSHWHWQSFQPLRWLWKLDFSFVTPCSLLRIHEVPGSSDTLTPTFKPNTRRTQISLREKSV